ncbi:ADP-ribosylglycohydrolase [Babesia caballi]|uniref:ADP-ribosylglycohydrolase n=1 Tax=Babesia caballi TaxID=5871 RepID=A0AAV4LP44_BABCB|nr:ADP-ribosylglycohydrolase [Babesia caballi]GIX61550.1 ADP-ribosylglycohydrolase [Babesia caballi]
MKDMGFQANTLLSINGSEVAKLLDSGGAHNFEELQKAYGHGENIYSNFIDELVQQNQPSALNYPLTNCHKIATHYLKSVFKNSETNDNTLQKIKQAFQAFKEPCGNYYPDYKTQITDFIKTCMTPPEAIPSQATEDEDSASPAGAVAGTLTTLGLGGGAAAAYVFNIGDAKTLVNGLLRIG